MLAEHFCQAFGGYGGEAATGEFGQAIEVQQLALREQHHQYANAVIQENSLHFARGIETVTVQHFFVGNAQLAQHQPNNRRSVRGVGCEGNVGHGLYPDLNNCRSITSLLGATPQKP
ncbi:hypothetical protein D9M69_448950 [compost metagenome]